MLIIQVKFINQIYFKDYIFHVTIFIQVCLDRGTNCIYIWTMEDTWVYMSHMRPRAFMGPLSFGDGYEKSPSASASGDFSYPPLN